MYGYFLSMFRKYFGPPYIRVERYGFDAAKIMYVEAGYFYEKVGRVFGYCPKCKAQEALHIKNTMEAIESFMDQVWCPYRSKAGVEPPGASDFLEAVDHLAAEDKDLN
jgi:hypothetical protein